MIKINDGSVPVEEIVGQLNENRPLPTGVAEFEEWCDRIISGALLVADKDSQVYALCNMLLQLGPHESHKPDAHFIHGLRKFAINQIADAKRKDLYAAKQAKAKEEEEAAKAANPSAEATLERAKGLTLVQDKAQVPSNKEV